MAPKTGADGVLLQCCKRRLLYGELRHRDRQQHDHQRDPNRYQRSHGLDELAHAHQFLSAWITAYLGALENTCQIFALDPTSFQQHPHRHGIDHCHRGSSACHFSRLRIHHAQSHSVALFGQSLEQLLRHWHGGCQAFSAQQSNFAAHGA